MAVLQYFKRTDKLKVALPSKLNSSECQLQQVNDQLTTHEKLWGTKLSPEELARNGAINTTTIQLKKGLIYVGKYALVSISSYMRMSHH